MIPILAALILGDVPTGAIFLAHGFRVYTIPSRGMEPSIMEGDRIVADAKFYETRPVKRGDVVIALLPNNTYVVKRVLAVEGDVIAGLGDQMWLNSQPLQEPYAQYTGGLTFQTRSFAPIVVLSGMLFLTGDNRDMSFDSRAPQFGQISTQHVRGKPLYVSFSRMPSRWGRRIE
jgi:signal peptidase I